MAAVAKQTSQGRRASKSGAKSASKAGISGLLEKVQSWPGRLRIYVDGLEREMRLVTWPSRAQVQSTTVVVLLTVLVFAVFFFVVDSILLLAQTSLYERFTQ
ncbi:MAG: preprotein translocase subunit SecE [Acidobacteria bacterium]|nr:preprotein translocase subunit SecE [Acidobacteriota bacterium]